VLDAARQRRAAEERLQLARRDVWVARVNLHLALGGDWELPPTPNLPESPPVPSEENAARDEPENGENLVGWASAHHPRTGAPRPDGGLKPTLQGRLAAASTVGQGPPYGTAAKAASTGVRGASTGVRGASTGVRGASTAVNGPSTAVKGPLTAVKAASTAVKGPSTAAKGPSTAAKGPSTAVKGPSTAVKGPSTAVKALPTAVMAVPAVQRRKGSGVALEADDDHRACSWATPDPVDSRFVFHLM
jgi:hypothetical protein